MAKAPARRCRGLQIHQPSAVPPSVPDPGDERTSRGRADRRRSAEARPEALLWLAAGLILLVVALGGALVVLR
jgi:hypothetical protein